jgi:stress response protein SCP2
MGVSLKKGQGISLKKNEYDLSRVTIGLGWDVAEEFATIDKIVERKKSGLSGLFGGTEQVIEKVQVPVEYDLDAIAFLLNDQAKVGDLGDIGPNGGGTLVNGDVIFYNNMRHKSGAIWLTGDNRTGEGDGDDEQIIVNLDQLPPQFKTVLFVVHNYQGISKGQNFSKVRNAYIRAVDNSGKEMVRFDISGDASYANCNALVFAALDKKGNDWNYIAIGKPYPSDSFLDILKEYM